MPDNKTYIVTIHSGGGSAGEAVTPVCAYGFDTRDEAQAASDGIEAALRASPSRYIKTEMWSEVNEVNHLVEIEETVSAAMNVVNRRYLDEER